MLANFVIVCSRVSILGLQEVNISFSLRQVTLLRQQQQQRWRHLQCADYKNNTRWINHVNLQLKFKNSKVIKRSSATIYKLPGSGSPYVCDSTRLFSNNATSFLVDYRGVPLQWSRGTAKMSRRRGSRACCDNWLPGDNHHHQAGDGDVWHCSLCIVRRPSISVDVGIYWVAQLKWSQLTFMFVKFE